MCNASCQLLRLRAIKNLQPSSYPLCISRCELLMADPVTIGAAVGWGVSAVGWVVSPIISKLLNKGFSYLSFDASEKLKQLEIKVVQLELMLGLEAVKISTQRNRLEPLLKSLKSAFYEAEDILDDVEYHRLERQILSNPDDNLEADGEPPSQRNWLKKLQSALPKCSCLKNQASGTTSDDAPPDMSKMELKKFLEKIENIINEAYIVLQLLNLPCHSNVDKRQTMPANPRGVVTTPVVIGRDEDRDKIIAMLHETVGDGQPESSSDLPYSIIGIHGIAGSGKSTLAQYVCTREEKDKQEEKEGHFDLIMRVHVSQNFSVHTILSEMIEQATGKRPQFNSLTALQKTLNEELRGKRFLLVLDDVWYSKDVSRQQELQQTASPLEVGELLSPLNDWKKGSKILVTSRNADALSELGPYVRCTPFPIPELDDDNFLEMFMNYALRGTTIDDRNRRALERIGAQIAEKLKRSPLAARIVGGQLRKKTNVDFWTYARNRDLLNETMGALWWSYQHLDEQVRRCFAYCSIFPRRHLLHRDELVNLWVAEGFIQTTDADEEIEDVGRNYFDDLVSTSFLKLGGKHKNWFGDSIDYFTVHDLLHDLAERVTRGDCFRIENACTGEVSRDVRHLFIQVYNGTMLTEKIFELENLRTLIIYTRERGTLIEESVFEIIFKRLRKLRVLIIDTGIKNVLSVPASIGQLKHLRYLGFGGPILNKLILPGTFTKLYYMQVLDFAPCRELVFSSGEDMINLVNLRQAISLAALSFPNIGRLTSLQTLLFFTVKEEPGYELQQLKHLNKLRGKLRIHGLENVESKEEALEARLANKERLTELVLFWDESCNPNIQEQVLEGLCPPMWLQRLQIRGYHGLGYPNWMVGKQNDGPKYLLDLQLSRCRRLGSIPDGNEFFLHLRHLTLSYCSWDALPDNMEHLTSLKELIIFHCMNIRSLPTLPQSLKEFKLKGCNDVFRRSCETIGDPNRQKIEHIPKKKIEW